MVGILALARRFFDKIDEKGVIPSTKGFFALAYVRELSRNSHNPA
jgi:hypothetical protein